MSYSKEYNQNILDLLNELSKSYINKEGAFCTSYVIVSEWMSADGQFSLMTLTDEQSPGWRHEGLLHYAVTNDIYATEEEEEAEDYGI
jgi:hypothetical protein